MCCIGNVLTDVFRPVFRHLQGDVLITRIQLWLTVTVTPQ